MRADIQPAAPYPVHRNVVEVVTPSMDPVYMDVLTQTHSQLTVSVNRLKYFFFIVKELRFKRFVFNNGIILSLKIIVLTMKLTFSIIVYSEIIFTK